MQRRTRRLSRLKQAIHQSGLKQTYISGQVGISAFRLNRIVNEHTTATPIEKVHLAVLLRSSVADLFQDEAA
jgi:predicted XRE-type DNA-binding protein